MNEYNRITDVIIKTNNKGSVSCEMFDIGTIRQINKFIELSKLFHEEDFKYSQNLGICGMPAAGKNYNGQKSNH